MLHKTLMYSSDMNVYNITNMINGEGNKCVSTGNISEIHRVICLIVSI